MSIVSEFKEFAVKGSVVDLAVGVIIGGAFGKIVDSMVDGQADQSPQARRNSHPGSTATYTRRRTAVARNTRRPEKAIRLIAALSLVANEGVVAPLLAEGRHRPVARDETDIITERPELVADRTDQRGVIAARQVGTADRALKQHIANHRQSRWRMEKHHVAGRVAGAVQNLQRQVTETHCVTVVQPAIGRERRRRAETEHTTLMGQLINPELVFLLRPLDWNVQALSELGRTTGMIDMAVCQQNFHDADPGLCGSRKYLLDVTTWINDSCLQGFLAPEQ